jgi:hypothetical protein
MYLKEFWIENAWDKQSYSCNFQNKDNRIRQWSIIEELTPSRALLLFKMLSLCLGGKCRDLTSLVDEILTHRSRENKPLGFGVELLPDQDKKSYGNKTIKIQAEVSGDGEIRFTPCPFSDLKPMGYFAYGYNSHRGLSGEKQQDYLSGTRLRHTRFETFFGDDFPAVPINGWLYRQCRNAVRYNSSTAQDRYNTVLSLITALLPDLRFSHWDENHTLFLTSGTRTYPISNLPGKYNAAIEFLVDFTRQMSHSRLNGSHFNTCDGILFIHGLEKLFPLKDSPGAIRLLADIFPNVQFIFTCQPGEMAAYIRQMKEMTVPVPHSNPVAKITEWVVTKAGRAKFIGQYRNNFQKNRFPGSAPASGDTVVLIDIDSKIPNLALMKISQYYKQQGKRVVLTRDSAVHGKSKQVFASCVFKKNTTRPKIAKLKRIHGEAIEIGGPGAHILKKLPEEIESLMPDYGLYPEMDFAMGFLTRGCDHKCSFCLVPKKEGALKQVSTLDDIVPPGFKKLVLLDNNLLAYPGAVNILKEIAKRKLQVNFNQTLDIRYLTPESAKLLAELDSRNYSFSKSMYYFSLNSSALIPLAAEKMKLLKGTRRHEIMFICMYGYNTTLSDDIERFSFLQKLGVSPFVQKFQPVDDSSVPKVENYFDTEIDALFYFYLNGRNFEGFLKWVSRKYVEEFGKLYMPLVDLIFKYNHKPYKHKYIESLAGTRKPGI